MDEARPTAADLLPRRPETRPTNETENHRAMTGIFGGMRYEALPQQGGNQARRHPGARVSAVPQ